MLIFWFDCIKQDKFGIHNGWIMYCNAVYSTAFISGFQTNSITGKAEPLTIATSQFMHFFGSDLHLVPMETFWNSYSRKDENKDTVRWRSCGWESTYSQNSSYHGQRAATHHSRSALNTAPTIHMTVWSPTHLCLYCSWCG